MEMLVATLINILTILVPALIISAIIIGVDRIIGLRKGEE